MVYDGHYRNYGKEFSMYAIPRRRIPAMRFITLAAVLCLVLVLPACQTTKGGGDKAAAPANPNETQLAYGVSLTLPSSWTLPGNSMGPEVTKASLDSRRANGERILILEALGPASSRELESMIGIFIVNQEGTFMPRDYAEKLQPEEFIAMSRDLLKREKEQAKKTKQPSGLLDLQLGRDTVGGQLAVSQRMLVAGPDGKPVRLINWDIYLPNGAGIAVKTVCDQEAPGAETEIVNIMRTMRIQ